MKWWIGILVVAGLLAAATARSLRTSKDALGPVESAVADVEAGRRTTPLVGDARPDRQVTVTFLARADGGLAPRIVSDVTGWGEHVDGTFDFTVGAMARVGRSDWYSLQASVAPHARIEYLIAYGLTDYRLDPHNPRRSLGPQVGGAQASEFVTPGYQPPQGFVDPPVSPAGSLTETLFESRALGTSRRVIVYTPPRYRGKGDYPLALFLDLRSGQVSRLLDWLIAQRAMEPIVAVFEGPPARGLPEPTASPMRTYLTRELPAWIASRCGIDKSARQRAILGISFGAKVALDAALAPAGAFGRLGLLIPGRRIGVADIDAVMKPRSHRLHAAILAGQYDHANLPTALAVRRALADAGDSVVYIEVPEGHTASTWRNHLREVLISLFGTGAPAR
jgi:enterochelin esterase-like enzyme